MSSQRAEPLSGFIEVNGLRLHYLDWGGAGAPVIVLHATGLLGRIYRPIAERLTSIGRVFSYDQRGHGDSDRAPDDSYDWYHTMNDLAGFITAMGFKSVRAFGHSAGATAIGSLAAEQPGLIERAVLAEPVVFESPTAPELKWSNPFIEKTLKRRRAFDSIDAMFANFANKAPFDTWRKDILRDYCEFGTRPAAGARRELKCAPEVEAKYYQSARDFDGLGRILKAQVPMLVMFGMKSDSLAVTLSQRIAAQLKRDRVINVPDAGHFLPMEKPEYVADETVAFLSAR
jgi:pimeloyl-ACP methyl ester carboxylesterase